MFVCNNVWKCDCVYVDGACVGMCVGAGVYECEDILSALMLVYVCACVCVCVCVGVCVCVCVGVCESPWL